MSRTTSVAPRGSLTSRFNDRKISTKIMAVVMVMTALTLAVGYVSTVKIRSVHDQASRLSSHNVAALDALFKLQSDFAGVRMRVLLYGGSDAAVRTTLDSEIATYSAAVATDGETYSTVSESDGTAMKGAEEGFAEMVTLFETQLKPLGVNQRAQYDAIVNEKLAPLAAKLMDSLQKAKDEEVARAQAGTQAGDDTTSSALRTILITTVIGLALALAFALWVSKLISSPLRRVQHSLEAMADRDLTVEANVHSRDEIGLMADALGRAQESIRNVVSMVSDSAQSAAAAADEMAATAQQIAASSAETSAQAGVVAAAAEEVSANVQTVATGSEEMGSSIREIAHNATEAARIAAGAVTVAENANATVTKLGDSSTEIGNVVKVITSIAEQTNLLALNATIEAARAGEAGKGFAVVAGEVKELAQETARATEDISRRVAAIQTDTNGAVEAIAQISDVIARISDFQTTIASAVEEQTATTNEMSRNVAEAAAGSNEIAANITGVASAATLTADGVTQTQAAIEELARMSNDLRNQVGSFTV